MNPEKLTIKSHEAILTAKELATKSGHPTLGPLHLLFALIQQEEGVVLRVFDDQHPERLHWRTEVRVGVRLKSSQ